MKKIANTVFITTLLSLCCANAALLNGRVIPQSCNGEEILQNGTVDLSKAFQVISGQISSAATRYKSLVEQLATPIAGQSSLSSKLFGALNYVHQKQDAKNTNGLIKTKITEKLYSISLKADGNTLTCFAVLPDAKQPIYNVPAPGGGYYETPESKIGYYCEVSGFLKGAGMSVMLRDLLTKEYKENITNAKGAKPISVLTFDKEYVVRGDCDVNLMCSAYTCDLIAKEDMRYIVISGRSVFKFDGSKVPELSELYHIPTNDSPF